MRSLLVVIVSVTCACSHEFIDLSDVRDSVDDTCALATCVTACIGGGFVGGTCEGSSCTCIGAGADADADTDVGEDGVLPDVGEDGVLPDADAEADAADAGDVVEIDAEDVDEADVGDDVEADADVDSVDATDVTDTYVPVCGDGVVEGSEECDGGPRACTSSCGGAGTQSCEWGCVWGPCMPSTETCNALDDDCDTVTDDGFACVLGSTVACVTTCGTTGEGVCNMCTVPTGGGCTPPAEVCDDVDNDCDTMTDEDVPLCGCYLSQSFETSMEPLRTCVDGYPDTGGYCPGGMVSLFDYPAASTLRILPGGYPLLGGTSASCSACNRAVPTPPGAWRVSVWVWITEPSTWAPCIPSIHACSWAMPQIIFAALHVGSMHVWTSGETTVPWTPGRWMLNTLELSCPRTGYQIMSARLDGLEYFHQEVTISCSATASMVQVQYTTFGSTMYLDNLCVEDLP